MVFNPLPIKVNKVILSDGTEIPTDMTILSIGVRPENELAKTAGLELGERGGIIVNEYLQTSNERYICSWRCN